MRGSILRLTLRSLWYFRKPASYQFLIIMMLAAIITGSLLTGFSVRESLKDSAASRIGNTGILISSGERYFSNLLASRLSDNGTDAVSFIETEGFCSKFGTDSKSFRAKIYGIDSSFFRFLGHNKITPGQGEAILNKKLADRLGIKEGEEIILNLKNIDDIPANSPFARVTDASRKSVYRIAGIVESIDGGDFSTGINQVVPDNIFIDIQGIPGSFPGVIRSNRMLVSRISSQEEKAVAENLKKVLHPSDIGLTVRSSGKTGETELISSRIFIDQEIIGEIEKAIPSGNSVITYLVNRIEKDGLSTPYSFVAAVDQGYDKYLAREDGILISKWLAEDLHSREGDTLLLWWYEPDMIRNLREVSGRLTVAKIIENHGIWADSLLMPEFPGIAASESCIEWDAGVKINTDLVREKDEEYWNNYRGTPKAFISYDTGKKLWGNNFGPATAIRFPADMDPESIVRDLTGALDPGKCGFSIRNLREEMIRAADQSVDFSTLFLSLGFFIIVACIILLVLAISFYLDLKKDQVYAFFALGFRDKLTIRMLFLETIIIILAGSATGALAGLAINASIIASLNSVWIGAVQSDTLSPYAGTGPVITGFIITVFISASFVFFRTRMFLKKMRTKIIGGFRHSSGKISLYLLWTAGTLTLFLLVAGSRLTDESTSLYFLSGGTLFISLILLWRQSLAGRFAFTWKKHSAYHKISGSYYSFHPSRGVMPVLLIAAGLFAVIVTGVNRLQITEKSLSPSGGTGGFKLWASTVTPVTEDMNSEPGKKAYGLDDEIFSPGMTFIQGRVAGGDDASCLNLNYVSSPPVLGLDPGEFIKRGSFSFSTVLPAAGNNNPWMMLEKEPVNNTIFGFADKTVMQWGLKKQAGDTLMFRSEKGELLNVILAGGLKSSLFQGYLLIGEKNFKRYFPSVSGSTFFLIDCEETSKDTLSSTIRSRFEPFGIEIVPAREKLASFFRVTNTYLSVFTTLGVLGMVLGVAGLGFVLRQNYTSRSREFSLLMASGYSEKVIKGLVFREQISILIAGVVTGTLSALTATWPSISGGSPVPWGSLTMIILAIILAGFTALLISMRGIDQKRIVNTLRRD